MGVWYRIRIEDLKFAGEWRICELTFDNQGRILFIRDKWNRMNGSATSYFVQHLSATNITHVCGLQLQEQ